MRDNAVIIVLKEPSFDIHHKRRGQESTRKKLFKKLRIKLSKKSIL